MPEIPKAPPSQISSEELERIFKNSGVVEEFYFPPEVPKPPSCFDEKTPIAESKAVSSETAKNPTAESKAVSSETAKN